MQLLTTTGRWKTDYVVNDEGVPIEKRCRSCNEIKPLEMYHLSTDTLFKRRASCKDCDSERYKEYYYSHRDEITEARLSWRRENIERDNQTRAEWYERNRDRINSRRTMYASNINMAARDFGLPAEFTVEDKEHLIARFGGCALTGETDNIHFDHVIPLSIGVGGTIDWNMLPLKAGLNISKGKKNVFEWFESNKERFNLDEDRFDEAMTYLAEKKGLSLHEYRQFVYDCFTNTTENGGR